MKKEYLDSIASDYLYLQKTLGPYCSHYDAIATLVQAAVIAENTAMLGKLNETIKVTGDSIASEIRLGTDCICHTLGEEK